MQFHIFMYPGSVHYREGKGPSINDVTSFLSNFAPLLPLSLYVMILVSPFIMTAFLTDPPFLVASFHAKKCNIWEIVNLIKITCNFHCILIYFQISSHKIQKPYFCLSCENRVYSWVDDDVIISWTPLPPMS